MNLRVAAVVVACVFAIPAAATAAVIDAPPDALGAHAAYEYLGVKWPSRTVLYWNGAKKYSKQVKEAARLWNRSGVRTRWKAVSKRKARLRITITNQIPSSGLATLNFSSTDRATGKIQLRTDLFNTVTGEPFYGRQWALRVVAHEMGHILGLNHEEARCSVMQAVYDAYAPAKCHKPDEPWRYRCRILEADDVRGAVKFQKGKARKLAKEFCDIEKAPPAATGLTVTPVPAEGEIAVGWTNAKRLGSTESFYIVQKRTTCPTKAELTAVASGNAPESLDVSGAVRRGQPGQAQVERMVAATGVFCVALLPTGKYGRPGPVLTKLITLRGSAPAVEFSFDNFGGLTVEFHDISSDPDDDIAGRAWNFGDGASSTESDPTHVYAAAGTYTVTLVVVDALGNRSQKVQSVTVASEFAP